MIGTIDRALRYFILLAVLNTFNTTVSAGTLEQKNKNVTLASTQMVAADCGLTFTSTNVTVYCRQLSDHEQLPRPEIKSECGVVVQSSYEDHYFELGCVVNQFSGYFDPSRWTTPDVYGAGGVDVTGAPNSKLLVEGTNNALVEVANRVQSAFGLVIPADGFISFDWSFTGGSITTTGTDLFEVYINDRSIHAHSNPSRHTIITPRLHAGDRLEFRINPASKATISIQDFNFITNASGIIERNWTAEDNKGTTGTHTQLITIERLNLSDIILPNDTDLQLPSPDQTEQFMQPIFTGVPFIDTDGRLETTEDRIYLSEPQCDLEILWEDELEFTTDGIIVRRTWNLLDLCNGSSIEHTQTIRLLEHNRRRSRPAEHIQHFLKPNRFTGLVAGNLNIPKDYSSINRL